jgi:hypothetical protein
MGTSGVGFGATGIALVRATDAMLQALGGDTIVLVVPAVGMPSNDASAQLGLVDPGVQQVPMSPVVVRELTTAGTGPRRRLEFLISSTAVAAELAPMNAATADALFEMALGIQYDGDLFHVESVTPEFFGGTAYLYRVVGVE